MAESKDTGLIQVGLAVAAGGAAMMLLLMAFIGAGAGFGDAAECQIQPDATREASKIPVDYLAIYQAAGHASGIPWTVIAAVGKVETNHGQSHAAGVHSGANHAGAMGPMQFLSGTWRTYGVDGDHDGAKNVYNPADAIPGAATYLKANGALRDIRSALFTYNRSSKYVDTVLGWARRYGRGNPPSATAAALDPACRQATAVTRPGDASAKALGAVAAAKSKLGAPYVWGGAGPTSFDCSGLTMWAYKQVGTSLPHFTGDQWNAGRHVPRSELRPGDLVFFYSDRHHMGMYIGGGKMVHAPHIGDVVKIGSIDGRPWAGAVRVA